LSLLVPKRTAATRVATQSAWRGNSSVSPPVTVVSPVADAHVEVPARSAPREPRKITPLADTTVYVVNDAANSPRRALFEFKVRGLGSRPSQTMAERPSRGILSGRVVAHLIPSRSSQMEVVGTRLKASITHAPISWRKPPVKPEKQANSFLAAQSQPAPNHCRPLLGLNGFYRLPGWRHHVC